MVEQLVGRCLEQGYMEAQESLQIDSMRAQQVCCQFLCSFSINSVDSQVQNNRSYMKPQIEKSFPVALLPQNFSVLGLQW